MVFTGLEMKEETLDKASTAYGYVTAPITPKAKDLLQEETQGAQSIVLQSCCIMPAVNMRRTRNLVW